MAGMFEAERGRADVAQKVAAAERQQMLKAAEDERQRKSAEDERQRSEQSRERTRAAILSSNIALAAINSSGRVVASSAGPAATAHSATVRSTTEATLMSWLQLNHILAADSEWDATALIKKGCTEGQDILLMDETEWTAVGFKLIQMRKLRKLKDEDAVV
jgi:hypothetical protein